LWLLVGVLAEKAAAVVVVQVGSVQVLEYLLPQAQLTQLLLGRVVLLKHLHQTV
jgi:hypothetical protein